MSSQLIKALQNPALYSHPVGGFRVVETHISWVLLTGLYAYKIKKPVDLGFVDFSTLEKREFYCQEELRLNSRLAPEIYADIVSIGGSADWPTLEVSSGAIEYAVKMVQFDDSTRLDHLLETNTLTQSHIDQLADTLARFHGVIKTADADSDFGSPDAVLRPIAENFRHIDPLLTEAPDREQLQQIKQWSLDAFSRLKQFITERKHGGFVRECHGDAHLANMVLIEDKVVLFDCLEFNANLRWIDVMSEIAFSVMDLDDRRRPDLANRLLDRYLQISGDYGALALLRFYQVYRAMVRAKVAIIRMQQVGDEAQRSALNDYRQYTALAQSYCRSLPAMLIIAHGVSGSGKTTVSQALLQQHSFIRIRSDVERKRLFGLRLDEQSNQHGIEEVYGKDANRRTFDRLELLARDILAAGFAVIVDATFLRAEERQQFRRCAETLAVPFHILSIETNEKIARHRIELRQQAATDASEAGLDVLDRQLALEEHLTKEERKKVIRVNNDSPLGVIDTAEILKTLLK